jgi:hypothetical protein
LRRLRCPPHIWGGRWRRKAYVFFAARFAILRLTAFLIKHHENVREGLVPEDYVRKLMIKGQEVALESDSKGYRFKLTPPVPVTPPVPATPPVPVIPVVEIVVSPEPLMVIRFPPVAIPPVSVRMFEPPAVAEVIVDALPRVINPP